MTLTLAILMWTQVGTLAAEAQDPNSIEPVEAAEGVNEGPSSPTEAGDNIVVTGEQSPENRVICVYEKKVGTSIKKRICRTVAQIEAEAQAARQSHGEMASRQASQRLESTRSN